MGSKDPQVCRHLCWWCKTGSDVPAEGWAQTRQWPQTRLVTADFTATFSQWKKENPFHLRMCSMQLWKLLIILFLPWVHIFLISCADDVRRTHEALCSIPKRDGCLKENQFCHYLFGLATFFVEHHFYLKKTTWKKTNYGYLDLGICRHFLKIENSELVTLRKNNWLYLLPEFSGDNCNFGRLVSVLATSQYLKDLNEISGDINECDLNRVWRH